MSVQLLNCQSQVENRQIFPCTEDMVTVCTLDITNIIFVDSS